MEDTFDYDKLVTQQNDIVSRSKAYNGNDYYITVRLSDFYGARIEELDDEEHGQCKYICLPIKDNDFLLTSHNNVLVTFRATLASTVNNKFTHTLRQVVDVNVEKKQKSRGFSLPLIGHMRPVNYKKK